MKCDVCGKEIDEDESYKGCCKECASKIFDRIEKNKTKKNNVITQINNENVESFNIQSIQKDDSESSKYIDNHIAASIAIVNDVLFVIIIIFSILILSSGFINQINFILIFYGIFGILVSFVVHLLIKGLVEIINLLDKISKK